ncbi:MAG: Gfo/Idh/MocA family oxidoreductase [Firmicutes bacterium]|nr:Gfo/Idh/MocA family oxidoreductase [Bacillota bacterium]
MADIVKIAIAGLVHDHIMFWLDNIKNLKDGQVVCVYDENLPLLEKVSGELNLDKSRLYQDYNKMFDNEDIDACIVFSETSKHFEIVKICAKKRIHVMLEKPIGLNELEAAQMAEECHSSGIKLMVNYIIGFKPSLNYIKKAIDDGAIGRVLSMRFLEGHKGPQAFCSNYFCEWLFDRQKNGGGAMMDFGCYGAALFAWYLGLPDSVTAVTGTLKHTHLAVEDNAVLVLQYGNAMGTIEATWAQDLGSSDIQVYGEEGGIVKDPISQDRHFIRKSGGEWAEINASETPYGLSNPIEYFVHCISRDLPIQGIFEPQYSVMASKILDAAKESARTGKTVHIKK